MFKQRKVGWSDWDRRELCEGGENYRKYLKMGCNKKERRASKDFKTGGKLGQGMGALRKRGTGIPLPTMSIIKGKT